LIRQDRQAGVTGLVMPLGGMICLRGQSRLDTEPAFKRGDCSACARLICRSRSICSACAWIVFRHVAGGRQKRSTVIVVPEVLRLPHREEFDCPPPHLGSRSHRLRDSTFCRRPDR